MPTLMIITAALASLTYIGTRICFANDYPYSSGVIIGAGIGIAFYLGNLSS